MNYNQWFISNYFSNLYSHTKFPKQGNHSVSNFSNFHSIFAELLAKGSSLAYQKCVCPFPLPLTLCKNAFHLWSLFANISRTHKQDLSIAKQSIEQTITKMKWALERLNGSFDPIRQIVRSTLYFNKQNPLHLVLYSKRKRSLGTGLDTSEWVDIYILRIYAFENTLHRCKGKRFYSFLLNERVDMRGRICELKKNN